MNAQDGCHGTHPGFFGGPCPTHSGSSSADKDSGLQYYATGTETDQTIPEHQYPDEPGSHRARDSASTQAALYYLENWLTETAG